MASDSIFRLTRRWFVGVLAMWTAMAWGQGDAKSCVAILLLAAWWLPLLGVEVAVAAGQRQPVVLADGRDADHLHAQRELPRHGADEGELLVVLLAEQREVGAHLVEQLGDHGRDAVEVRGAALDPLDPVRGVSVGRTGMRHVSLLVALLLLVGGFVVVKLL